MQYPIELHRIESSLLRGARLIRVSLLLLTAPVAVGLLAPVAKADITITSPTTWDIAKINIHVGTAYNYSELTSKYRTTVDPVGKLENHGFWTNVGEVIVNPYPGNSLFDGTVINYGTVTNSGTYTQGGKALNELGGVWINSAGASLTNTNTFENNQGTVYNRGTFTNNQGGDIFNRGTMVNQAGGTLINNCFFENRGSLVNEGTLVLTTGVGGYDYRGVTGSTFTNRGTVQLYSDYAFSAGVTDNLEAGSTLNSHGHLVVLQNKTQLNQGALNIYGSLENKGTLNNASGATLWIFSEGKNQGTINNAGTLALTETSTLDFTGGTLNNSGHLSVERSLTLGAASTGAVNLLAGGLVQNWKDLTVAEGHTQGNAGTLVNEWGSSMTIAGTLVNSGVLTNTFTAEITQSGTLVNQGTLSNTSQFYNKGTFVNQGHLSNTGDIYNQGTLEMASGSSFDRASGSLYNSGTLVLRQDFVSEGYLYNEAGSTIVNYATLTAGGFGLNTLGSLDNRGTIDVNTSLAIYSDSKNASQYLRNSGIINIRGGGVLDSTFVDLYNSGQINNDGLAQITGSAFQNTGELNNRRLLYFSYNFQDFKNSGTVTNAAGAEIYIEGTYLQTDGVLRNDGQFHAVITDIQGGLVTGNGTYSTQNPFVLGANATLAPGNSIGKITIDANLISSGNYLFEIGGVGAGKYDLLSIHGSALFNGGLFGFSFVDGFRASAGDYWDFLSAYSISGWETLRFDITGLDAGLSWRFERVGEWERLSIVQQSTPNPVPDAGSSGLLLLLAASGVLVARRSRRA